jgi:hypothetical protein
MVVNVPPLIMFRQGQKGPTAPYIRAAAGPLSPAQGVETGNLISTAIAAGRGSLRPDPLADAIRPIVKGLYLETQVRNSAVNKQKLDLHDLQLNCDLEAREQTAFWMTKL